MEVRVLIASNPLGLISLEEAKSYLQVDYAIDDALITMLTKATYQAAERYTNASFLAKTLVLIAHFEPIIELPYGPAETISEVVYTTSEGEEAITDYQRIGNDIFLPTRLQHRKPSSIRITYVAGLVAAEIGEDIKLAILKTIFSLYETRGNEVTAAEGLKISIVSLSMDSKKLLNPHRRVFL